MQNNCVSQKLLYYFAWSFSRSFWTFFPCENSGKQEPTQLRGKGTEGRFVGEGGKKLVRENRNEDADNDYFFAFGLCGAKVSHADWHFGCRNQIKERKENGGIRHNDAERETI